MTEVRGRGLRDLRRIYRAFALSPVLIFAIAVGLLPRSEASGTVPLIVLALYTVGAVGFAAWGWSRPLNVESELALAGSFRTRFFFRIAMAESPSLMGLVAYLITGILWPYVITLLVTVVLLALAAPTDANIDRAQQEVVAQGSGLSLREALELPMPRS